MNQPLQGYLPIDTPALAVVPKAPLAPVHPGRGLPFGQGSLLPDALPEGAVRGTVRKILFSNPEKGFYVLQVNLDGRVDEVAFVGPCEPVRVGDRVEASGRWELHARHGRQLRTPFVKVLVPSTGREIHAFLRNGGVKGVGKATADKLYAHHGEDLAKVVDKPTLLMQAKVSEKQALLIVEAWNARGANTELAAFLGSLSLGPASVDRVLKAYGARAKQRVLTNPYDVAKDIPGFGFRTADQMALALGVPRDDPRRVQAAVLHAMDAQAREGHCAVPRPKVLSEVRALLMVEDSLVKAAVAHLIEAGLLIEEDNGGQPLIVEARVKACEEEIARRLVGMRAAFEVPADLDARITQASQDAGIPSLHEHQALAVRTAIRSGVCIITGGPGSGKTSSLEVLLRVFEGVVPGARVALCAPTGRAAQRMGEATGRPALTIHRLLGWGHDGEGFDANEENPIPADIVVVDEASMLDIWLARDILRAIPKGAVLVLIGDVDQLPSVGPGRVLGDAIDSGAVPVARLTRIFRQGEGSKIAEAARSVNAGRLPVFDNPNRKSDFWGAFDDDPVVCMQKVVRMATEVAPSMGFDPMRDVQFLVAGHGGSLGTAALNRVLQDALNPERPGVDTFEAGDLRLRTGDRVIQTANNYDLDVFNGDIGRVVSIDAAGNRKRESVRMLVDFDGRVVAYAGLGDVRELAPAYAISVHKSQGSEFPCVVFVASTQHFMMLRKTLVYTALTRARKLCVVVGQKRALTIAVRSADKGRLTGLARRLAVAAADVERRYGGI
jgi:exodeoxyribonuclease V alpha subunit